MKKVIELLEVIQASPKIHRMTFIDTPTSIIRVTRRGKQTLKDNFDCVITIGKPNSIEKSCIKKLKYQKHNFASGFTKVVTYEK